MTARYTPRTVCLSTVTRLVVATRESAADRRFPGVIRDERRSLDPELPPNVCEFRNHKGEVLYADTLTTTSAPEASKP